MKLAQLLRHIEKTTGASVSVHILHPAFLDDENLQLTPDQTIHHGPFCREMKLNGNFPQCHSNKQKCISIARTNKSFSGECPFGLWEMVVPFFFHDELSAIIFMGHLRQKDSQIPEHKSAKDISIPILTDEVKEDLQKYARFLKDFLRIEIELWLFSGGMSGKKRNENYYIANAQRFIESNFMKNISLAELSETLRVNPNYLGELLKKSFGKTFRQILAEKRVHESMLYLKLHDNMNISQIAAACGFEDSNYFSQVFRKITGLTPSGYQKSVITKNDL